MQDFGATLRGLLCCRLGRTAAGFSGLEALRLGVPLHAQDLLTCAAQLMSWPRACDTGGRRRKAGAAQPVQAACQAPQPAADSELHGHGPCSMQPK